MKRLSLFTFNKIAKIFGGDYCVEIVKYDN